MTKLQTDVIPSGNEESQEEKPAIPHKIKHGCISEIVFTLYPTNAMGKGLVKNVLLQNYKDVIAAELGVKPQDQVRTLTIDMIADTGAVAVSLPQSMVEQLGLRYMKEVMITVSTGEQVPVKMYGDLMVHIGGREAYTQCLAKPEDAPIILGQLVLKQIDYVVDCKHQKILPNPQETNGMMLFDDF